MMSRQMNLPQIQRILQDFEKESSQMDMKEEMMGDSIDDAMEDEGGEGEEEEGDRILEEVLAEIGISVGQQVRPLSEETGRVLMRFDFAAWRGAYECTTDVVVGTWSAHGSCDGGRRSFGQWGSRRGRSGCVAGSTGSASQGLDCSDGL
jgi:hypothetical protein